MTKGVGETQTPEGVSEPLTPSPGDMHAQTPAERWVGRQLGELVSLATMARTAIEAGASTVALEAVRQVEAVAALDAPAYRARWAEKHGPAED